MIPEKNIASLLSELEKESEEYYSLAKVSAEDAEVLSMLDF